MKPFQTVLLALSVAGVLHAQSPVLSFPFDGSPRARESSSSKVVGKLDFEKGVIGLAGTFRGSTWIEVPDSSAINSRQFSIAAWASPEQEKCSGRIVEKGASNSYWLTFAAGRARFGFWNPDDGYVQIDSETKFKANEWHHVAGTFDGSTLRLYVDGKLESMQKTGGKPSVNKQPLVIGAKFQGIAGDCFIGALDEVSYFNKPLSDSEVSALYRAGDPQG